MYKLNSVKCGVIVLSFLIGCGSALAKKAQFDESAVSAITLDVLRVEACMDDTDECLIAGGPKQMSLFDLAEGKVDFARQVLLPDNTTELRLVLGDGSSIAVNGESLPLEVPSGQTSGLKLKGGDVFAAEGGFLAGLALDFDLGRVLVVQEKNGKGKGKAADAGFSYSLKPVIQIASADVTPLTDEVAAVVAMPDEENEVTLGDKFSLFIPAGAVSAPMVISVKETKYTVEVMDEETGEVVKKPALSSSYELNPDGAEFAVPLEIAIPYYPETLPSEVSEYDLAVYLDGEKIPTDIDAASKIAAADVWHFSTAGVFPDGTPEREFQTQMPVDNLQPDNFGWKFMSHADYQDKNGNTYYVYHPAVDLNVQGDGSNYPATDLNVKSGTIPVYAIANGIIIDNSPRWGGVVIEHYLDGEKYYSQYGHINHMRNEENLTVGSYVRKGEQIGRIGMIGMECDPTCHHLHFEIRRSDSFHPNPTNADFWPWMDKDGDILKIRKEVFKAYESPLAFVRSYENPYQTVIIVEDSVTYPGISNDIQDNKVIDSSRLPLAAAMLDPDLAVVKKRFFKSYPDSTDPDKSLPEWSTESGGELSGFGGNYHYAPTVSGNITTYAGTWYFDIPTDGLYKVSASIPASNATSEKARYRIYHNKKYDQVIINQAVIDGTLDERWVSLGIFDFAKGNDNYVKLLNSTGEDGKQIGFDAIKLVKVSDIAVSSVSPETATIGQSTIFTISGPRLSSNLEFLLDDCANINPLGGTSTSMQFRCTPSSAGIKSGTVKLWPLGITLSEFTVNVVPPVVTSVSPASATLGVATDFTVIGKNMPSTLTFQLEDCIDVEPLGNGTSSTYKQFRCTPSSTGEKKNGTLTDKPNGTVLKNFSVDFIAAPPPSDDELVLKAVRVIPNEELYTGGTATYRAEADFSKNIGTSSRKQPDDPVLKIIEVTDECTWSAYPTNYVTSLGGGLVQAKSGTAGQEVKVKCSYYDDFSGYPSTGTRVVTIK